MSSERNILQQRTHLGSVSLKKVDLRIVPPSEPQSGEIIEKVKSSSIITSFTSWVQRKQKIQAATTFAEQFNQNEPKGDGLIDLFKKLETAQTEIILKNRPEVVESKNIISTGGGDANIDAAIEALKYVQLVNEESVKRGEPHQQIPVSAIPKIMGDIHGAEVREVSLQASFQELDLGGRFVRGEAGAYASQVIPYTEQKLLQAERTQQEIEQALVPIRREITMATIEAQTNMVVVAGVQQTDQYGNVSNVMDELENNQKQLNSAPEPHNFWNTDQPEISYAPGYNSKEEAA